MSTEKKTEFNKVIQEHLDSLLQLAYMRCKDLQLAEDLVQDACLKAYNSFLKKGGIENPKSWLYRILINTHIDYTRKKKLDTVDIEEQHSLSSGNSTVNNVERNMFYKDLEKALNELDESQKTVIYLSDIQEYSYKEISKILDIPTGTVMSRLHRARQALRKILVKEEIYKDYIKI